MLTAIVEGHGEVVSAGVLLRRLQDELGQYSPKIGRPIRRKRSEFVREDALRHSVRLALLQGATAILILFDADEDCPKELAPRIEEWAKEEAGAVPVAVVLAKREFEAWFLASIESLRGLRGIAPGAAPPFDPEAASGAKEAVGRLMGRSYSETTDQPALAAKFDLAVACRRTRSFRKLVTSFGGLVGAELVVGRNWPPAGWMPQQE